MARKKSWTRKVAVLLILGLACVGGYSLWNGYGEPVYEVVKDKANEISKVLKK
jgi:hypothetical protein